MIQHGDCLRYRGGRDATLTQEQPGAQAWKDHNRKGTQRAQEGSTWGFLPGSMWPNVQTWWLGRREEETQGPGGPLLCFSGQAQEPELREPV